MLLAIDIGNSRISGALMRGPQIKSRWRIPVDSAPSYRRIGPQLLTQIGKKHANLLKGACIVSVVPGLNPLFRRACKQSLGIVPLFATPMTIGMPIPTYNRRQVGPDRLVVATAAYARFRRLLIVVDAGSAITIDCVSRRGEFLGGAILPGIEMATSTLHQKTARLPRVEVRLPTRTVGRSTPEAIRAGVIYGTAGALERIIHQMKQEMRGRPLVIATGGDARLMARACPAIRHVYPDLIFEGLGLVWERNR